MLLRFGVENHLSIRDYQELLLTASVLKDDDADVVATGALPRGVLPGVAIYGANASGKSNILAALYFMRNGVLSSHSSGDAGGGVPRKPFALDPDSASAPSRYDCDVLIDGVRYHYGFVLNEKEVQEEWLYAYPSGHRQVWFHRSIYEENQFHFGRNLRGQNKVIERLTRSNSLFLSAAAQNNHKQLSVIYKYFRDNFIFRLQGENAIDVLSNSYLENVSMRERIARFLSFADTGIRDVRLEEKNINKSHPLYGELKAVLEKHVKGISLDEAAERIKKISLGHETEAGEIVYLDIAYESRGTQHLLSMLGPVFDALENGKTIVVDELDTSMHPLISAKIINLFASRETNKNGGQIIFSTHDSNLLSAGVLRRDQIWFTEKDHRGATHLVPLTDLKTRNSDNLQRGYLQGRYGGIPYLGDLERILEVD